MVLEEGLGRLQLGRGGAGSFGWAMYRDIFTTEPLFLTTANPWERFRIGPGPGSSATRQTNSGTQFPVEHYEKFHETERTALDE